MKIQSLSVVVPAKNCINNCKFCVSQMHDLEYENMMSDKNLYYDLYKKDYINRLEFARDNGCNTVMLTGDCEPLQNQSFLTKFADYNATLEKPFRIIEIQTVGNLLTDDYLYFLRHHVGVTTISLSVNTMFSDALNCEIIGCAVFSLEKLCERIKKYRFNLRLSLNMVKAQFEDDVDGSDGVIHTKSLIYAAKNLGADQITFRKMYSEQGTDEGLWVDDNQIEEKRWADIYNIVRGSHADSRFLDKLEYGRSKYDVRGMSVVIDDDCMSENALMKEVAKYLILRPNAKLYSKWDTKGSLIF